VIYICIGFWDIVQKTDRHPSACVTVFLCHIQICRNDLRCSVGSSITRQFAASNRSMHVVTKTKQRAARWWIRCERNFKLRPITTTTDSTMSLYCVRHKGHHLHHPPSTQSGRFLNLLHYTLSASWRGSILYTVQCIGLSTWSVRCAREKLVIHVAPVVIAYRRK